MSFSFGSAPSSTFGAPAAASASSFSFGTPAAAPTTGFGSFGTTASAPAAPTTGFGSFGTTASTPAAPVTGFGSFGTTASTPAATTGFGSTTTAPSAFGGFGTSSTPASAPASSFGSFGASSLGGTLSSSAQPSSFSLGGFGAGTATFAQSAPKPQGPTMKAIEDLQRSYAPMRDASGRYANKVEGGIRNDECSFKAVMLNKRNGAKSQAEQLIYGELLEQAERDNTDPENYVPVEELGIDVLKARFDQQNADAKKLEDQSGTIMKLLKDVGEANDQLSAKFNLLKMKQLNINKKVLSTIRKIEVLRCHGTPLQRSELLYKERLDRIAQTVDQPFSRVQDMAVNLALQEIPQDLYADIDEDDLESLIAALKKQSEGVEHLAETLRKDIRDINIVQSNMQR